MTKRTKQLVMAFSVPVLILLGMCFTPLYTLMMGEEITLETIPVDPSDVLRGDYVTLRYQAEEIPKRFLDDSVATSLEAGGFRAVDVYVLLEEENGVHSPAKVSLDKPETGLFLKGKLNYIGMNMTEEVAYIEYSLDRYYVEDNTGTEWEKASAQGDILVKAKVKNGYAILTDLMKKN
nr:GDYXXLXY domain-containing protein [Neobacillus sp. Marseille-Q6967]